MPFIYWACAELSVMGFNVRFQLSQIVYNDAVFATVVAWFAWTGYRAMHR